MLREAVETPGRTARLITPDRALARRVAARLDVWGIAVEDAAGLPFGANPSRRRCSISSPRRWRSSSSPSR